jgi:type VI secretion system protein ImpA
MPLRDDLLNPIAGANPAGADLRYDPLYDKIKEARREEDNIPQGEWERPRKMADWPAVIKLTSDAIATKSKDLQLAAWLTEALLRREGFGGLAAALTMLKGMLTQFWDGLYPEIEDGDLELRATPLDWVGGRLELAVKGVPLSKAGHSYWQYKESQTIPTEKEAEKEKEKSNLRKKALDEGKIPADAFEKGFDGTPKLWYRQLAGDLNASLVALQALGAVCAEKFADAAPGFGPLKEHLEEVLRVVSQFLERKLQIEPDPVEPAADAGALAGEAGPASNLPLAAEPVDRNDAAGRILVAARFLRRTEPTSPVSYLMLRALRWGELRAEAPTPDPRLLEAPAAQTRTQLKTMLLDQDFAQLLELAETVMGSRAGRGWLDLQRYVLNALDALGQEYGAAGRAVRRELRALLAEIPTLPVMTLMDDLPTAGPATVQWLTSEGLLGEDGVAEGDDAAPRAAPAMAVAGARDQLLERSLADVRIGQAGRAIDRVKAALDRETSERGRFLRQSQLARVMMEAGLYPVAMPLLKQLVAKVDENKLEAWEAGPLIAEPMVLLHRCYEKSEDEPRARQELYLRICRLDPVQALTLGAGATGGTG